MKKKLPTVNKGFGDKRAVRQYIQEKIDANKISKELDSYLCEREIYTPKNYDLIREKFSDFLVENTDKVNAIAVQHNKEAFLEIFDDVLKITNDFVSARMLIHCCISEFSLLGGAVSVFEYVDNLMIDQLHTDSSINR